MRGEGEGRRRGRGGLVIWFVRSAEDFEADVERVVRDVALAIGLVDYKVALITAQLTAESCAAHCRSLPGQG